MYRAARKTILGLVVVGSLFFAVSATQAAPTCVVGATTTCTFNYTGTPEAWVVPAGVTSGVFDVDGAEGGSFAPFSLWPGGSGGKGGRVQATVALTPGATLNVRVGGKGTDGLNALSPFTVAGGFNGGGTNSVATNSGRLTLGGAGGGSSDVRTSGDALTNRLLVAGGGGGAGTGVIAGSDLGTGGNSATAAKSVTQGAVTCSGGGAGTLVGPGAPGSGPSCASGQAGDPGGLTGGGNGGDQYLGAGGGGYFGGGAGAATSAVGSGGGGGSDYVDPSATFVTITDGFQSGNGLIKVTYATPTAATFASAGATRTATGILVRWRTGTEVGLLGFHVYRSRGHSWRRISHSLIGAKGSVSGASYRFLDKMARRGISYRYRIKAVNRDGTARWFAPVRVM